MFLSPCDDDFTFTENDVIFPVMWRNLLGAGHDSYALTSVSGRVYKALFSQLLSPFCESW